MIAALLFLQYHSLKNRTLQRFRRLKQPKYLVGGIVGALYFYFYFFRYLFGLPGRRPALSLGSSPESLALYEAAGAAVFLVAVLLAWLLPHDRAALTFSEAEVAFLFPAPISRRGLVHFKLLRSQAAILFTTLILMLFVNRFGGKFWIHAAGWWLILSTLNLHLLGSSFARTALLDRGITNLWRRFLVLILILVAGLSVLVWTRRSFPAFNISQMSDWNGLGNYLGAVLTSGPLPWMLYPFRLVIRPYLAMNAHAFLMALGPALAVLAAHYWWVIRSDVAFEEASLHASRRSAERLAAIRSGQLAQANVRAKGRRPPFKLGSIGSPVIALLWKNLISAGQAFTPRLWILVAVTALTLCGVLAQSSADSNLVSALGMAAGMLVVWSLFIGPHVLRQDLRQDLPLSDVLKSYPIRGWEVALGELLAPATILTGVQWLLLLVAAVLLWNAPSSFFNRALTMGIAVGAALISPTINLLMLQIPNAAVMLFPAWFQTGKERATGIEVTGQRIIAMCGQLLVFIVALIPATIAFGAVFFVSEMLCGRPMAIVLGCAAAAIVLAGESALGLLLLGRLFERFDVSAELLPSQT